MQANAQQDVAALVGRILVALIFVISGFGKITGFAGTAGYMASKGLPMPEVLLVATILIEFVGGLMLMAGVKTRLVALAFVAFLVPVTAVFHNAFADPAEMNNMLKNISIAGAMLLLFAFGPGRLSFDGRGRD